MELSYRFGFDAAHHFTHFPAGHPNQGVHGHSFQVEVAVRGEPDPRTGFIVDVDLAPARAALFVARARYRPARLFGAELHVCRSGPVTRYFEALMSLTARIGKIVEDNPPAMTCCSSAQFSGACALEMAAPGSRARCR